MPNTLPAASHEALRRIAAGSTFGRWTVIGPVEIRGLCRSLQAKCKCDCGTERYATLALLVRGTSKSCGCLRREVVASQEWRTKHGLACAARRGRPSQKLPHCPREVGRGAWVCMIGRCYNPADLSYRNYGGRGITVCESWRLSFRKFINDMGPRPSDRHSIDRIDNDGNYEPSNCRWATATQQARNKRTNRMITLHGETMCVAEWAERAGRDKGTVYGRLRRGLAPEQAIFGPLAPNAMQNRKKRLAS